MKAIAVTDVGKVESVELPVPKFTEYECLVKMTACGLCNGTDLKHIDGTLGNVREQYPVILGHEAVGEIVEVGAKVRNFQVGDIITDPTPAIDDRRYHSGCAGFCEYGVMQDLEVMRAEALDQSAFRWLTDRAALVRTQMSAADAAMLVTFKETYSAIKNFDVGRDMSVLIYGDGPNGLSLAALAREAGADWVGVVGHWDSRLERIAETAQADQTINSKDEGVADALGGKQVDLVIDAVGSTSIIKDGFRVLKKLGRLGVFGVLKNTEPDLSIRTIPNGACLQMLSWPVGANEVHDEIVEMVASGRLTPSDFYSEVSSWENIEEAIRKVRSREAFKIVLTI